jgi:hypothetical protein
VDRGDSHAAPLVTAYKPLSREAGGRVLLWMVFRRALVMPHICTGAAIACKHYFVR